MRYDLDGISLWYGTPDAPAPDGVVESGDDITLNVAVQPVDASNRVEVRYRIDGGPVQAMPARWLRNVAGQDIQYFRAQFPHLRPGDRVEYAAVCHRAGRQVPAGDEAERLVATFRISGGPEPVTTRVEPSTPAPMRASIRTARTRTHAARARASMPALGEVKLLRRRDDDDDPGDPDDPGDTIPMFSVQITSPTEGGAVRPGEQFPVHGTTSRDSSVTVQSITVGLGEHGSSGPATDTGGGWSTWSFTGSVSTAGPLKITAFMSVRFPPGMWGNTQTSVSIVVDGTSPALTIVSPNSVSGPGQNFPVLVHGTASDNHGVASVNLRVGNQFFPVTGKTDWQSSVLLRGEGQHEIEVEVTDYAGNKTTKKNQITAIDNYGPVLRLIEPSPLPSEFEAPVIRVRGSATDGTGINWVKWRLDNGDLRLASPERNNDWALWHADIPIPSVGPHTIEFTAEDTAEAKNRPEDPLIWSFSVAALSDIQGISQTSYLRDLLEFAQVRIQIEEGTELDKATLSGTFFQPFDRLDDAAVEDMAKRSVSQVRICIESLRQLHGAGLSEEETEYRKAAYFAIFRNIGTS